MSEEVATERVAIVAYLRGGGDMIRGQFYGWDSEMRSYAKGFADYIERGEHLSAARNQGPTS